MDIASINISFQHLWLSVTASDNIWQSPWFNRPPVPFVFGRRKPATRLYRVPNLMEVCVDVHHDENSCTPASRNVRLLSSLTLRGVRFPRHVCSAKLPPIKRNVNSCLAPISVQVFLHPWPPFDLVYSISETISTANKRTLFLLVLVLDKQNSVCLQSSTMLRFRFSVIRIHQLHTSICSRIRSR